MVADELALRRALHSRTNRIRAREELCADLIQACISIGLFGEEWEQSGVVESELTALDRTLTGIHSLLVALRAQEAPNAG